MTELLYLEDSYKKEFEATVAEVNGKFIVLDKTVFYPESGGQLCDAGRIVKGNEEYKVVFVKKFPDKVSHEVDKEGLKVGDKIKGIIDWERRYRMMRSHTAAHIICAVFHKEAGALITGNQLGADKIRIDFSLENFDREKIDSYIEASNQTIERDLPIKTYYLPRDEAEQMEGIAKLAKGLPPGINTIRIIEIIGFDRQADGGTHVKTLKEVGRIKFLNAENKGKNNRRIYFELE